MALDQHGQRTFIVRDEGDIYAKWACVAEQNFHLLTRSMHDRALADGTSLYERAASLPIADPRLREDKRLTH